MRHPKVDRLEELIEEASTNLEMAIDLAKLCLDKATESHYDYNADELLYDLNQALDALDRPMRQFTEVHWKTYKKRPIEDLASAY